MNEKKREIAWLLKLLVKVVLEWTSTVKESCLRSYYFEVKVQTKYKTYSINVQKQFFISLFFIY